MDKRSELISFGRYEWHKGFYNYTNAEDSLCNISYTDFFATLPDDDDFAYDDAYPLLRGSCHVFAVALSQVLGYTPYIIESENQKGFHAFCQTYQKRRLFYVDARGATTSFDEFMDVAKSFVHGEFVIRKITTQEIEEWKRSENYFVEALSFAEEIIKKYEEYYRI